jgi:hypothetical protein
MALHGITLSPGRGLSNMPTLSFLSFITPCRPHKSRNWFAVKLDVVAQKR